MAKIRKSRIHWQPSSSSNLKSYRLYWSVGEDVHYDSDHADVGLRTEIVLPDDVPSFPLADGDVQIGITAVTERGNESDMVKATAEISFAAPEAPSEIQVQDMEDYYAIGPAETGGDDAETEEPEREEWRSEEASSSWRV